MGGHFKNRKKSTPIQIMNSANMNVKNIVNNIGILNDSATMNSIFSA